MKIKSEVQIYLNFSCKFYGLVVVILSFDYVLASVTSCYACAGPKVDCVENNRTDFLKMDCNTFTVDGVSLISRTAQPDILEKFDNEVGGRVLESEVGCLTLTFNHSTDRPTERALKSCVPAQVFDVDICTYMEGLVARIGGEKSSCYFCKKDDCNSEISTYYSNKSVLFFICLIYFSRYFFCNS